MHRNETDATKRHVGPQPFYGNGSLVSGLTFTNAAHEVLISKDGSAWADAGVDATEIGSGYYDTLVLQASTDVASYFAIMLRKSGYNDAVFIQTVDQPVQGTHTLEDVLSMIASGIVGPVTGWNTGTHHYRDLDNTKDVVVGNVGPTGRSGMVYTP